MSELTDLELRRKAWEALGGIPEHLFDFKSECQRCGRHRISMLHGTVDRCDAPIESNAGIALEELVKFCEKEHFLFQLEHSVIGGYACHLVATLKRIGTLTHHAGGKTPAEAICMALIKAAAVSSSK